MQDTNGGGGFSLSNLRGTTLAILLLAIGAALGLVGLSLAFRGSVGG